MSYTRIEGEGGYKAVITGKVSAGELLIEETWQYLIMSETQPAPVGEVCTLRTGYLNGEMITDPALAHRLHEELTAAALRAVAARPAAGPILDASSRCIACGVHWNLCPWCESWWTGSHSCPEKGNDHD